MSNSTARIARRHRVTRADIRAVPPESLFMRQLGGGLLEVLSIVNGSVTRLGRIHCDGPQEKLIRELKPTLVCVSDYFGRSSDPSQ